MIVNIETRSGTDFSRNFFYRDSDGNPISLVESKLEMMVRRRASDATVYLDLSTDNSKIFFVDRVGGVFMITIDHDSLNQLAAGTYEHALILIKSTGLREELWHGTLTHVIGATR